MKPTKTYDTYTITDLELDRAGLVTKIQDILNNFERKYSRDVIRDIYWSRYDGVTYGKGEITDLKILLNI